MSHVWHVRELPVQNLSEARWASQVGVSSGTDRVCAGRRMRCLLPVPVSWAGMARMEKGFFSGAGNFVACVSKNDS